MVTFKNRYLIYAIDETGRNISLKTTNGKTELLDPSSKYCSRIITNNMTATYPTAVTWHPPMLKITYENGVGAVIKIEEKDEYITFALLETTLNGLEYDNYSSISFLDIKTDLDYSSERSSLITSCMSMSLKTKIKEYPGKNNILLAEACPHIGMHGTKAALILSDGKDTIRIMRAVLDEIADGELPKGKYSGPYACDSPDADDTYTLMSKITLKDVDKVISDCEKFGVKQIHFHQGTMFTQGDFRINLEHCPGGEEELKQVIQILHRAGIKSILHPYTFFIDNYLTALENPSKYLSPIPHKDLAYDQEYILAEDIDDTNDVILTVESLSDVNNRTGYRVSQTNFLWIDNELILLGDVSTTPDSFTGCSRGVCKTIATKHKRGTKIRRLISYFTYLSPGKNTKLFFETAWNTADFYNRMDFDGFYLDAIDGVFILDGNEYAWYHSLLFINELFKHIKKSAIFNCCYGPQYPSTWYARTRMGALDSAQRGYRDFIDIHVDYNTKNAERMFFTGELGWWSLHYDKNPETLMNNRIMFDEDIEYLLVKMLSTRVSQCWQGSFVNYITVPLLQGYCEKIKTYEKLKRNHDISDATKKALRQASSEFVLCEEDGDHYFKRTYTKRRIAENIDGVRNVLSFENSFASQKPKIRIEALLCGGRYDEEGAIEIASIDENKPVTLNITYEFADEIDASNKNGMGIWICGDGKGETVCFRLRNDHHVHGGYYDHYIKVDFNGWRYFAFAERNNAEMPDEDWPRKELEYKVYTDVESFYCYYTIPCRFNRLKFLDIMLDPRLDSADYGIKLKPVRMVSTNPTELVNPSVQIGGETITFMTSLQSNTFLEYDDNGCFVYDLDKNIISRPEVKGRTPVVLNGINEVTLSCENKEGMKRAALTLLTYGDERLY